MWIKRGMLLWWLLAESRPDKKEMSVPNRMRIYIRPAVDSTNVHSQEECVTHCSQNVFPIDTARVYTYYETPQNTSGDNCFCLNKDAHPTPNPDASSGVIQRKTCTCENGTPVEGRCEEAVNNGERCQKCNNGYDLQSDHTCQPRICQCSEGLPSVATQCPLDGLPRCQACNEGYHIATNLALSESGPRPPFKQRLCIENQCKCANGEAATRKQCPVNGALKCESCQVGYTLLNDKCIRNQCSCFFGQPAAGLKCRRYGNPFCSSCKNGYHLQTSNNVPTGRCIPNQESQDEDILV